MIVTKQIKKYLKENYISKKKIQQKIKDLEEEKRYYYSDYKIEELNTNIEILKEILREEENG